MVVDEIPSPTRRLWIDLGFAKAVEAAPADPWLIEVVASTPRLDFQGERVLPVAMQDGSAYFMRRGVVTFEHLQRENRADPSIIIGHPTAMQMTAAGATLVKAMLYKHQPKAQHVWQILISGGRLGASIGGDVLERSMEPGGTPIISRIWFNHLALTAFPVNDDTSVQITPYHEFMAKALSTSSATPLVQQDLEGARERGTPSFEQRCTALTATLQQQYPTLTEAEARRVALALLQRRGATRDAYVSTPPGAIRS
jgi:hypothetical protein